MGERIAVVGAGAMGANHVRTLTESNGDLGAKLCFVVDPDTARAQVMADKARGEVGVLGNVEDLDGDRVDGVILASPSHLHAEQAVGLLERGVAVLVEKPAAMSEAELDDMERAAEKNDGVIMVGHVEKFNPVVHELRAILGDQAIRTIRAERLGTVGDQQRLRNVGDVVRDLTLHDLTIVDLLLQGSTELPEVLAAVGRADSSAPPDPVDVSLDYGRCISAHLYTSRAYPGLRRRLVRVETDSGEFEANLLPQQRRVSLKKEDEGRYSEGGVYIPSAIKGEESFVSGPQPLDLEQRFFLRCMRGNDNPEAAGVSLDDARKMLRITNAILAKMVMVSDRR